MDFNKIYFIIIIIVLLNLFFVLASINIILWQYLFKRPLKITNYYIKNIIVTLFCSISYISFFFIFLYCLRIYRIASSLDLKEIYSFFYYVINTMLTLPLYSFITSIIFGFLISCLIILCIINLHKYCAHEIYKLYLYVRYYPEYRYKYTIFNWPLFTRPTDMDIISYFFSYIIDKLFYFYFKIKDIFLEKSEKELSRFHPYKIFRKIYASNYYRNYLIPFSPLLFIIYDCFYNNYVLVHVYYFMLVYVPVMLFRRISRLLFHENIIICELFWDMFYLKETCFYALPLKHKKLLEIYVSNGIRTIDIDPTSGDLDLSISYYIKDASKFKYNMNDFCYENNDGNFLEASLNDIIPNSFKIVDWVNQEKVYSDIEWYIIVKKYFHPETADYITITKT